MDNKKYWLWLTMVFGVGSRRIWELMSLYETPDEAYYELRTGSRTLRLYSAERNAVASTPVEMAEQILAECDKKGIRTLSYDSPDYPPLLRHLSDPPAILYYIGDIRCLTGTKTITAVGARRASDYSLRVTKNICERLSAGGIVIISGFAVGVDITSHLAAASQERPTACIMGCGLDVDYPRENFRYRDAIIEAGGVLISEYPPGTPPHSSNFPKRNRILAALGRAAVVFEASVKSGSLITASLAAEQGRDVYCMPPADIFDDKYSGNSLLLSEGAIPFFCAEDIASTFGYGTVLHTEVRAEAYGVIEDDDFPVDLSERVTVAYSEGAPYSSEHEEEYEAEDNAGSGRDTVPDDAGEKDEMMLEGIQKDISDALSEGPLHADTLAQRLGVDSSELMTELTEMELLGAVKALPGKMYEKL